MVTTESGDLFLACYGAWTREVAQLIIKSAPGTHFGLYSRWGSGKTSAALALQRAIESDLGESGATCAVVYLDAARLSASACVSDEVVQEYNSAEGGGYPTADLAVVKKVVPLVMALAGPAERVADLVGDTAGGVAAVASALLTAAGTILPARVQPTAEHEDPTTYERVVILLDDLDRCDPHDALRVLKACMSASVAASCNVVVACDPDVLARHAAKVFGVSRWTGLDGVNKYVHTAIALPVGRTNAHRETLEQAVSHGREVQDAVYDAAASVVGLIPVRQLVTCLPMADLLYRGVPGLEEDPQGQKTAARAMVFFAVVSGILPGLVQAAGRAGIPGAVSLVTAGAFKNKNSPELQELLPLFGGDLVDLLRERPDVRTLGIELLGGVIEDGELAAGLQQALASYGPGPLVG